MQEQRAVCFKPPISQMMEPLPSNSVVSNDQSITPVCVRSDNSNLSHDSNHTQFFDKINIGNIDTVATDPENVNFVLKSSRKKNLNKLIIAHS